MKTKQTGMWHWFRYTKTGHQIYSSLVFRSSYNRTEPELKAELSKKTGVELSYENDLQYSSVAMKLQLRDSKLQNYNYNYIYSIWKLISLKTK